MEEEKTVATNDEIEEQVEPQEDIDLAEEQPVEEAPQEEAPKKKSLKGLIEYIKTHENLRQPILFFLFSMICGGSQMLITLLFTQLYRVGGVLGKEFPGFMVGNVPLFAYASHAEFIGFLIGSVVGQVLTFVLNRKKTFNVHDHIPFRAVAYAIMAVAIIFVQTLLGGAITVACRNAYSGDVAFLKDVVFNLVGQAVGGISALIISFLCNKFFVMRKFKGTASADEATANGSESEEPAEAPQEAPEE
ncbi:MAG: hypothetical protein J5815_03390 [Clostridia bacterium]|nr:hypothetical protein [Clostridia bacterium]